MRRKYRQNPMLQCRAMGRPSNRCYLLLPLGGRLAFAAQSWGTWGDIGHKKRNEPGTGRVTNPRPVSNYTATETEA